jgi:predicted dinucleotide-binding enzyme
MRIRPAALLALSFALLAGLAPSRSHAQGTATKEIPMKDTVAIIGTGRMGGAFGANFAGLGHPVIYGSRDPAKPAVGDLVGKTKGAKAMAPKDAAAAAEIVVLAVPWAGIEATVAGLGDLAGKLVIDATNALSFTKTGMEMAVPTSAGEMIQGWLPKAKVVKAFNTVGFFVIANPKLLDGPVAVFLAGEDADAKAKVRALVGAMGFEPVDVGGIKNARVLESMSILYMVPYLGGKTDQAFEWAVRSAGKREAGKVRPAQ